MKKKDQNLLVALLVIAVALLALYFLYAKKKHESPKEAEISNNNDHVVDAEPHVEHIQMIPGLDDIETIPEFETPGQGTIGFGRYQGFG